MRDEPDNLPQTHFFIGGGDQGRLDVEAIVLDP